MKNIKNLKLKIGLIVVVLVLMIVQISPFQIFGDEKELVFTSTQGEMIFKNTFYTTSNVNFYRVRIGTYPSYCLDLGLPLPVASGNTVKLIDRKVSDITTSVLYYGYPNRTAAQLGVLNDNEAELTTQLAVWVVAGKQAGGDSQKATQVFSYGDLVAKPGYEETCARVTAAVKRLVEQAYANPYYSNPLFTFNSSSAKMVVKDTYMIAGPYTLKATGFNATSVKVSLSNAPKSAIVCDANGVAKTTFKNGENVYVKMDKTENGSTLTINATATGSTKVGKIYGTGVSNDGRQDYVFLKEDPVSLNNSINLKWSTLKGNIDLYKIDQYNNRIANVEFVLKDSTGKVVATKTTDANGYIAFTDLKIGNYTLTETKAPEGYIKVSEPLSVTVPTNSTIPVTFKNKKVGKAAIEITKVDRHDNSIVLEGAIFNLLDANGNIIYENRKTNSEGKILFDNLQAGTYKLVEVQAPNGYIKPNNSTIEIVAKENVISKLNWPNERVNGGFVITKIDENGNPVEGVKFNILDANKKLVETITTGKDGKASTTVNLLLGTYYCQEVETLPHLVLDNAIRLFTIEKNAQLQTYEVTNYFKKGTLKIVKKDEDGKLLEGVVFEILDSNKKVVDTITTNAKGEATTKKLLAGTYYYKEISIGKNTSLVLDNKEVEFKIENSQIVKEVVNKFKTGKLRIVKTDEDGKALEGVKFEIYSSDKKTLIQTITTDKNGLATTKALRIGSYFYKEVEAPEHVIMDTNMYEFSITENGQTLAKTIKNELQKGKLQIVKTDENKQPLANVKFEILDKNNKVVDTIITNAQGIAESKELAAGEYFYKEVEAPSNIILDSEKLTKFTMGYKLVKLEVTNNYKKGVIQIEKTDSTGKLLEGVEFEVYASDKKTVVDTLKTDKDGIATSKELIVGTYYVKETKAPDTVIKSTKLYDAVIKNNKQVVKLEIVNELVKAKLQIEKVTEDGKPLEGVTFQVYNKATNKVVDTITTNEAGYATSKELPQGEYYFVETKAPDNVVIDTEKHYFTMGSKLVEEKVVNKYATGKIKIIKTDSKNRVVEGVKFEIYAEDKKTVVDTITTDAKGEAITKELKAGIYYCKEVDAPDYVIMDTELKKATIEKNAQVVTVRVENEIAKGCIRIVKTSDEGEKLSDVTFQILNENKEVVETMVTGENGIATSKDLECGTYYYREVDAPVKVIMDKNEYKFEITKQDEIVEISVVNKVVKGSLKIVKTDDLKTPLEGVVFQVLDSNKNVIEEITTNKDGIATSKELRIGRYYYKEIKAPDNVVMDEELHDFTISSQRPVYEAKVVNTRICGKVVITKVDKDTKAPIANVTFQILNENKEVINTIVTDKDGIARLGDLPKGKYYYKEVDAPDEYIMESKEGSFEITRDIQTRNIQVENEHKKLPQTGGFISTDLLIVIIVAVVSIAGYVVFTIVKNKKAKNTKTE